VSAARKSGKLCLTKASPILGAARATIGEASGSLVSAASEFSHSFEVDVALVSPDPEQPRRYVDPEALGTLASTLARDGQLQPVLLRPDPRTRGHWIIVAGERRWRAAKLNGWTKLLAIVHHGDPEIASLLENLQRVDLSPLEEARGINRLLTEKGWTQEQAAVALGKGTSDISGTLRIMRLPASVLDDLLAADPPPAKNVLIELARIEAPAALARLAARAREGRLTIKAVRDAREKELAAPGEWPRGTTPPAKPARDPSEGRAGWPVVVRAAQTVAAMATEKRAVSAEEAQVLRTLRAAIDAALHRYRPE
jgi:ParB family chromosome partitioning protein